MARIIWGYPRGSDIYAQIQGDVATVIDIKAGAADIDVQGNDSALAAAIELLTQS